MRKYLLVFGLLVLITIDQMTKWVFQYTYFSGTCSTVDDSLDILTLCHRARYIPLAGEYLGFQLSYNTGVAFSLPIEGILLQSVTLLLIAGLFYQYITVEYRKKSVLIDMAYVLIGAGALSHAYERIFVGHVVDFIAVKYFAILNIADIFISVGAIFLIFAYVGIGKRQ